MANDEEPTTRTRPRRTEGNTGETGNARSSGTGGESDGQKKPVRKTSSSGTASRPAAKKQTSPGSRSASSDEQQHSSGQERHTPSGNGAERSPSSSKSSGDRDGDGGAERSPSKSSGSRMNTAKAAREAMNQLEELTNRDAEGIVGIEKNDDGGWTVTVEVVESRRIPDTADVLAEYDVRIDSDGDLTEYSRQGRYVRGRTTRGE